jgi:hypothetical protein
MAGYVTNLKVGMSRNATRYPVQNNFSVYFLTRGLGPYEQQDGTLKTRPAPDIEQYKQERRSKRWDEFPRYDLQLPSRCVQPMPDMVIVWLRLNSGR